jgi:hypothetical protein
VVDWAVSRNVSNRGLIGVRILFHLSSSVLKLL